MKRPTLTYEDWKETFDTAMRMAKKATQDCDVFLAIAKEAEKQMKRLQQPQDTTEQVD